MFEAHFHLFCCESERTVFMHGSYRVTKIRFSMPLKTNAATSSCLKMPIGIVYVRYSICNSLLLIFNHPLIIPVYKFHQAIIHSSKAPNKVLLYFRWQFILPPQKSRQVIITSIHSPHTDAWSWTRSVRVVRSNWIEFRRCRNTPTVLQAVTGISAHSDFGAFVEWSLYKWL